MSDARDRALLWLPADGSWRDKPGRHSHALNSLLAVFPQRVAVEWAHCGPRSGWQSRWRLTLDRTVLNKRPPENAPNR